MTAQRRRRYQQHSGDEPAKVRPIRVTQHRWDHYARTAADHNLSLSRWIIELCDQASGYRPPEPSGQPASKPPRRAKAAAKSRPRPTRGPTHEASSSDSAKKACDVCHAPFETRKPEVTTCADCLTDELLAELTGR